MTDQPTVLISEFDRIVAAARTEAPKARGFLGRVVLHRCQGGGPRRSPRTTSG